MESLVYLEVVVRRQNGDCVLQVRVLVVVLGNAGYKVTGLFYRLFYRDYR